jgi:uncharacterized membrane protein YkoI
MKQIMTSILAPVMAVIFVLGTIMPAQSACLSAAQVRDAIAGGEILSAPQIYALAGVGPRTGKEVLDATVCEQGGQLYYRLVVFDKASGSRTELQVNARTGAS